MSPHKVPTLLNQPDYILGKLSIRQVFLGGVALSQIGPMVYSAAPQGGPALGDGLRVLYPGLGMMFQPGSLPLVPLLLAGAAVTPFIIGALPLDPPVEHGALSALGWIRNHGRMSAEQYRSKLGRIVVKGNRVESDFGHHAVWELPGINLRLADAATTEVQQELWGEFANGLTKPVQTVTIANRQDPEKIVGRIEQFKPVRTSGFIEGRGNAASNKGGQTIAGVSSPQDNARMIAGWLRQYARSAHLIERRHFLAFVAEDEQEFVDTEEEIQDGLASLNLRQELIRRLDGDELREVIQRTWSRRDIPSKGPLGPREDPYNGSDAVWMDGEWHIVISLGRWPRILRDNALAPLIDGPYEVDVIENIEPIDSEDILDGLERRLGVMQLGRARASSKAARDLEDFIDTLTDGTESPFDVSVLLHIHAPERDIVKRDAKRILKRLRRSGARGHRLTWEQSNAMASVAPLGVTSLDRRTKRVDTSSIKRIYPWSASTMWMEDAVPWGETLDSHRPVGWNPWRRPLIANPHYCCYCMSGGGKGFGWKVWSSRALFAGLTQEFFGFDQAIEDLELGEYGRWAQYCGIEYRHVKDPSDFEPALADLNNYRWLGPGIEWNIAQLPTKHRPQFLALVKDALWKRASEHPARRQWAIDELWSFVKLEAAMGVDPQWIALCMAAIEDLIRMGRHLQLGGAFFTQRVKDSLEVPLMQIIQSQASSQSYGMQNPSEITSVQGLLHWTEADVVAIKKFTSGSFLMNAGPWRVSMKVTASDEEFAMANTDGRVARINALPTAETSEEDAA